MRGWYGFMKWDNTWSTKWETRKVQMTVYEGRKVYRNIGNTAFIGSWGTFTVIIIFTKFLFKGFPGGANGKESACQCKRRKSNPWARKIPHAMERISPCATTLEPGSCSYRSWRTLEPALHNTWSLHDEKTAHRNTEEPPLTATRRKPARQTRPSTATKKWIEFKYIY